MDGLRVLSEDASKDPGVSGLMASRQIVVLVRCSEAINRSILSGKINKLSSLKVVLSQLTRSNVPVSLSRYKGKIGNAKITVNIFLVTEDDGKFYPTKCGCFVQLEELKSLAAAVKILHEKAQIISSDETKLGKRKKRNEDKKASTSDSE